MIETWRDLLDFVWWALTGREDRPRHRPTGLGVRPAVPRHGDDPVEQHRDVAGRFGHQPTSSRSSSGAGGRL